MNTSFPSTASEFGALIAGGKQPSNNSELKGILAGLGCAKSATAGSASTAKKDFDEMLDAPATAPTGRGAQSVKTESSSSIRTGEQSAVVTTTLQIRDIVGGRCHPAPVGQETSPSEEGETALNLTGEGETQPDSQAAGTETASIDPTSVDVAALTTNDPAATETTGPKPDVVPGPTVPRQIKLLPGRGQSMRGRGWNPAFVQHTGVCGKSAEAAKPEMPLVKVTLPLVSCTAPATNAAAGITPDLLVEAIAGIPSTVELPPIVAGTDNQSSDTSADLSTQTSIDTPTVALTSEPAVIVPAVTILQVADESRDGAPTAVESELSTVAPAADALASAPVLPDASSIPPAQQVAAETHVLSDEISVTETAMNDVFAPVLDAATEPTTVVQNSSLLEETAPITPEVRREVVETVAAMLAPFLANLPLAQPELTPVASSDGVAADTVAREGGNAAGVNSTVTIKIGAQSPVAFELPQMDLTQSATVQPNSDELETTTTDSEKPGEVASTPTADAFVLPDVLSHLAEEIQPLDFRVQIRAKIEAAWQRAAQPEVEVTAAIRPIPAADDIVKADVSVIARTNAPAVHSAIVSEKVETDETGNPTVAVASPVADGQVQGPGTPVEVMIKMPGYGVLTAQMMTAGKPAVGLSRTEKTAGAMRSAVLKDGGENNDLEKTFLTTGQQSVKGKAGNAGTDVAISDDTMPARFTSRRVTVDPLELPSRFNAREIQPVFNASQNFSVTNEAPVTTTPAPVLAHRAVETILNVVEAQRESAANASSVNLHFKFGGDDLAVRVQMRGGEVLTQFLTDSAELRSALSNEWQTVAGQGVAAGLRMQDPLIVPTSAGTSNGFGSMAQGQNQARQQAQQQQQDYAASAMPELHSFRRSSAAVRPQTEPAPRVSFAPSTSQHLTATA